MSRKLHLVVYIFLLVLCQFKLTDCQAVSRKSASATLKQTANKPGRPTPSQPQIRAMTAEAELQAVYMLDPSENFCRNFPRRPFYQRVSDGAICCRGMHLPPVTISIAPETSGECAISTRTDANGMLDSEKLWCAYTCRLKKMGLIDSAGKVVPEAFFARLSEGLTEASKIRVKSIMKDSLECFKPMKNSASPCHTPLSFQKCYLDALYYVCSFGQPKPADLAKIKKLALDYEKVSPACVYNKRKIAPGCCHGKPMPWVPFEIMEAPTDETKLNECLKKMGPECDATCFMNSIGVVNSDLEVDVGLFQKKVLQHFPSVKASSWMDFLGPVFLFYDAMLADMGDESSDTAHRVCRFHDRVLELHESKVEQYCAMSQEEVKELIKTNAAG